MKNFVKIQLSTMRLKLDTNGTQSQMGHKVKWDSNSNGTSERPKRQKSVSAETEISAKLTENSAEISAEILPKIT